MNCGPSRQWNIIQCSKRSDRERKILSQEPGRWRKGNKSRSGPSASSPAAAEASTRRWTRPVSNRCSYAARRRRRRPAGEAALALQRLRKAEKDAPPAEKPEVLKTRRRDTSLLPETVGSVAGVCNGKTFSQVETKPEMTATTRRVLHHLQAREAGPPGIGATHSSRLIPLE